MSKNRSGSDQQFDIKIQLQPKQMMLFRAIRAGIRRPLYGGAKGGGKSYGSRMSLLAMLMENPGTVGLLIRRTYPELYGNHILPLLMQFPEMRNWYSSTHNELTIPGPVASKMVFGHAQHEEDIFAYAGREFDYIAVEEVTQFTELMYNILSQSNRTTKPGIRPVMWATGNPGGIGHLWVKRLWIDREFDEDDDPDDYVFIPAKVWDNPALMKADPKYVQVLKRFLKIDPELGKAYLNGVWDIYPGQFFGGWNKEKIEIEPFSVPLTWPLWGVMDYGETAPTSFGLYTKDYDGVLYRLGEYYRSNCSAETHAKNICEMIAGFPYTGGRMPTVFVGPPDMWVRRRLQEMQPVNCAADEFANHGLVLSQANDDRVNGWRLVRSLVDAGKFRTFKGWNEMAMRTIPALQRNESNPEDVVKGGEDHAGDEVRYAATHVFGPATVVKAEEINPFSLAGILSSLEHRTKLSESRYGGVHTLEDVLSLN